MAAGQADWPAGLLARHGRVGGPRRLCAGNRDGLAHVPSGEGCREKEPARGPGPCMYRRGGHNGAFNRFPGSPPASLQPGPGPVSSSKVTSHNGIKRKTLALRKMRARLPGSLLQVRAAPVALRLCGLSPGCQISPPKTVSVHASVRFSRDLPMECPPITRRRKASRKI